MTLKQRDFKWGFDRKMQGGLRKTQGGIWDLETQECFRLESVYLMIQQVWSSLGDKT